MESLYDMQSFFLYSAYYVLVCRASVVTTCTSHQSGQALSDRQTSYNSPATALLRSMYFSACLTLTLMEHSPHYPRGREFAVDIITIAPDPSPYNLALEFCGQTGAAAAWMLNQFGEM